MVTVGMVGGGVSWGRVGKDFQHSNLLGSLPFFFLPYTGLLGLGDKPSLVKICVNC